MEPFTHLDAIAAPLALPQCDTDQLVPARFLSRKRTEGYANQLFHDLRFSADGGRRMDFVLNQDPFSKAKILVADENFGCGSSRESAVWALYDYGFRAVIAPSFGDIFFNNSTKNGLLAIVLPTIRVSQLRKSCNDRPGTRLHVDLATQCIWDEAEPDNMDAFQIDPLKKRLLMAGMDEISYTLTRKAELDAFEAGYIARFPWLRGTRTG